jgi:hypothetical protein
VLIVAHTGTFLTELSLFGKLIGKSTSAEPVHYCAYDHWTADEFAGARDADGVKCLRDPLSMSLWRQFPERAPQPYAEAAPARSWRVRLGRLAGRLLALLPGIGARFAQELLALRLRRRELYELFRVVRPRLLVLGGDMAGYDTGLFVQMAHQM